MAGWKFACRVACAPRFHNVQSLRDLALIMNPTNKLGLVMGLIRRRGWVVWLDLFPPVALGAIVIELLRSFIDYEPAEYCFYE